MTQQRPVSPTVLAALTNVLVDAFGEELDQQTRHRLLARIRSGPNVVISATLSTADEADLQFQLELLEQAMSLWESLNPGR